MYRVPSSNYPDIYDWLLSDLLNEAVEVDVGEWHGRSTQARKELISRELRNVVFEMNVPTHREDLVEEINPNLPWAEMHFAERVSGEPMNPPPSHTSWPWASANDKHQTQAGQAFSHSYPERLWPPKVKGLRFLMGDLNDAVTLLERNVSTRQCFVPIWFPEDVMAAHQGERVPCTLGYHFLIRGGEIHTTYMIRSCDFVRYFADDIYMACRLAQWIMYRLKWAVNMGTLTFLCMSLHCFNGDLPKLRGIYEQRTTDRAQRALG
jgi:thymidylate synthase